MSNSPTPQLGTTGRILEGLVTTRDAVGRVNVAPMGPLVGPELDSLVLRPFATSTTCANLSATQNGVFHTTDDVLLIAQAAIGIAEPEYIQSQGITVLAAACSWFAFEIVNFDATGPRAVMLAHVTHHGTLREFLGYNRAQHGVIEAAILATRVHLLSAIEINEEFNRLRILVSKTGSEREHQAFNLLEEFVSRHDLSSPEQEAVTRRGKA